MLWLPNPLPCPCLRTRPTLCPAHASAQACPCALPPQIWRPITSCFFIAGFSMKLVIELLWLLQYGVQLEKDVYATQPADYVFMLLFGAAVLQLADTFVPFVDLYVFGSPLVYMIMYVWARFNPDVPLKIMGIVPIMSFYLPFAMLAVDILFGASPIPGGCGIMVGHLWWFLTDLYPRTGEVLPTAPSVQCACQQLERGAIRPACRQCCIAGSVHRRCCAAAQRPHPPHRRPRAVVPCSLPPAAWLRVSLRARVSRVRTPALLPHVLFSSPDPHPAHARLGWQAGKRCCARLCSSSA